MSMLEVWGGVECTVNRVNEAFHDQLQASGHDRRLCDLDRFAALGLRRIRYPVLWERVAPDAPSRFDWQWTDQRLQRLQELGIDPVVGLLHHGSGPSYTNLLDERFPALFADYSAAVAARYPWVNSYTPINEPLTTARFSALYGHWYPHQCDDRSFTRALINQCLATVLAMREIRKVNPTAQLIQTDDLGFTTSTPRLAYQARFDNQRRWLAWDLLCGHVDSNHPLWDYLRSAGVSEQDLLFFAEHPCPPDVIGVNHYVTSDRHLDEHRQRFAPDTWGGNGRDVYADVEAIRVIETVRGLSGALQDAWQRYRLPLAVTEVHLGCTREEQLRWLWQAWNTAQQVRATGADVRAITVWALLGSFDWNSLLTASAGYYEPGVFDTRGPMPRPTALAKLVATMASGSESPPPALVEEPGWWQRPARLFPTVRRSAKPPAGPNRQRPRTLLIAGAGGMLGVAFGKITRERGLSAHSCTRAELDICDERSIEAILDQTRPWALINAAGYARVDEAENQRLRCYRENSHGPTLLANACAKRGIPLLTFSSAFVFDRQCTEPYVESHAPSPMNTYGWSQAQAERTVRRAHPGALIVRTGTLFGPWDAHNYLTTALRTMEAGEAFTAIDDSVISATYVPDLVHAALDLLIDEECGLWHLTTSGSTSLVELVRRAAAIAEVDASLLRSQGWRSLKLEAARPAFCALTSERGLLMPSLDSALQRYAAARSWQVPDPLLATESESIEARRTAELIPPR